MYQDAPLTGISLPNETLCLTFDDGPGQTDGPGPGPRTVELAQYLNSVGVAATFFMVGKFASDLPDAMPELESLGHLIGNHTYDHPHLVEYDANGGDVVFQVSRTDGLIRNWIDAPVIFLRPPYGAWSSGLAQTLNANLTVSLSHVGPINWDIDGGDWSFWMQHGDPGQCAANYLQAIQGVGRGIVLMHDCTADMEVVRRGNRTLEMVQQLVPALQQRGYRFARIDEVPEIAALSVNKVRVALRDSTGLYVSPQGGGGGAILVNGPAVGAWEPLVVEDLYVGKVALRTVSGHYISPQDGGGGAVLANGPTVGDWEPLDLISLGNNRVAFRTITGDYLTSDQGAGGVLHANRHLFPLLTDNIFTFEYLP